MSRPLFSAFLCAQTNSPGIIYLFICFSCVSAAPVLVHCGVSDGQWHHSHAVHMVRHTLRVLYVPVDPTRPWDPLWGEDNTIQKFVWLLSCVQCFALMNWKYSILYGQHKSLNPNLGIDLSCQHDKYPNCTNGIIAQGQYQIYKGPCAWVDS